MEEEELKDAVLLLFANKQDLPNALSASELTERLKLNQVKRSVSEPINLVLDVPGKFPPL